MDTAKTTHLQFIQYIINRLSNNSFLLKGWTVVLVSALFALSSKDDAEPFILLAFFPAIVFWGLDGYFLAKERQFRRFYDYVRSLGNESIDFSMNIELANKNPETIIGKSKDWLSATFSITLATFYGVILISILIVYIYLS